MVRIAGVNLPNGKHADIALMYIYGVGRPLAITILDALGIEKTTKIDLKLILTVFVKNSRNTLSKEISDEKFPRILNDSRKLTATVVSVTKSDFLFVVSERRQMLVLVRVRQLLSPERRNSLSSHSL